MPLCTHDHGGHPGPSPALGKDAACLKVGRNPPGDEPEKIVGEPFLQLISPDIRVIILL